MSNSSKILVYVDCSDGTPVDGVRVESDGIVGEVIKKVRDMRAMYHVDCSKVKVFSGSTQVLPGERIEKVLANDSGGGCSDQNPLKLEFRKYACLTGIYWCIFARNQQSCMRYCEVIPKSIVSS